MLALLAEGPGVAALEEVPAPRPGPGEVVVRVEVALTCGTDLKLLRRGHPKFPFPLVLGHEWAGSVAAAGEGVELPEGLRVTAAVTAPCGECGECRGGKQHLCDTAFDRPSWGAFAERMRVPARVVSSGLLPVPDGLPLEAAALLDPVASVVHALVRSPLDGRPPVLVYGSGPISLVFAALLPRWGAGDVFVAGRREPRLARIRRTGARVIDLGSTSASAVLSEATGGRGAGFLVDTTGDASLVPGLVELVAKGGTLLLFAGMPRETRLELPAYRLHYDEVTVAGSFHYRPADVRKALELLSSGALPVEDLVTRRRPLAEWAEAFGDLSRGDGMKTALLP